MQSGPYEALKHDQMFYDEKFFTKKYSRDDIHCSDHTYDASD